MRPPGILLLALSVAIAFTADICFPQDPAEHEDEEFPVEEVKSACVMVVTSTGNGSGFFVTPNGHVVTSFHVIADEKNPYIKTSDGRKHKITHALTYSIKHDLVLLATTARNTPSLQIGDPKKIKLNMSICTIGHPHGLEWTFTKGYIAGYRYQASRNRNEIQFSADVSPGSSGGPVVGTDGKVYGVVTLLEIRMLAVRESTLILDPSEVLKFGISADTLNTMMYSRKYPISLANLAELKKRIEHTNDLNFLSYIVYESIDGLLNGFEQIKVNAKNTYDHKRLDTRGNPKVTSSTAFLTNTRSFRVSATNVDLLHRFFSKKLETDKTKDPSINASYGNLLLSLKNMIQAIEIVDSINGMDGFDNQGLQNRKAGIYRSLNKASDYFYDALGGIEQANRRYGSQILEPQKSIFTNVELTPAYFMTFKKHCDGLSRANQGIFRYRAH